VTIDLSNTKIVDSSVMEKLHEMRETFQQEGLELRVVGLEDHNAMADHQMATRLGGLVRMRRLTVLVETGLRDRVEGICLAQPLVSFATQECAGRSALGSAKAIDSHSIATSSYLRTEVFADGITCERIIAQIRSDFSPADAITVYSEPIDMMVRR
jgi:hypothetical protein